MGEVFLPQRPGGKVLDKGFALRRIKVRKGYFEEV